MIIKFGSLQLEQERTSPTQWNVVEVGVSEKGKPTRNIISHCVIMPFAIDEVVHAKLMQDPSIISPEAFLKAYKETYLMFNAEARFLLTELSQKSKG